MSAAKDRFMWLFVFFDLPVKEKHERHAAAKFRNFLLKDGYMMIQLSVYCRICNGQDRVDKHIQRVQANLPPKGSVRAMQITDKQYERMKTLVGNRTQNEKTKAEQLVLF
jgi:CRISPR-associated protein Cas2